MTSQTDSDKSAPGDLALVQGFVNTADLDHGTEELTSPTALRDWLAGRDLAGGRSRATQEDLARALEVREGLRAVLYTHNAGAADPQAVERLEAAANHASLRTSFAGATPELAPVGSGVDAALARLLGIVATSAAGGSWQRLKACADPGCRWAFYDHSKNRSGRWCSMAVCGNQQKARAYRERARSEPS